MDAPRVWIWVYGSLEEVFIRVDNWIDGNTDGWTDGLIDGSMDA